LERSEPQGRNSYKALVGKPGVVYVLENDGLRHGWVKIGCSTRSGHARAMDLNIDANTGTPGAFRCVHQVRTTDCGTAEQEVFARLSKHRRGKWGQEYFDVDLALAKETIREVCSEVDQRRLAAPPPVLSATAGDVTYQQPSAGIPKPARSLGGAAPGRSRWHRSGRPPRRRWTTAAIIIGVVVLLAAVQGDRKSQRATSGPAPHASNSTPKVAKAAAFAKPGTPAPTGQEMARPDGPRQAPGSHAAQEFGSASDSSVPASPRPGTQNSAGSSLGTADAVGKARDGDAPGLIRSERSSNAASCSSERMMQDPAAYSRCLNNQAP